MASSFKVLSTNHTSFTVSSLDRSIAFFKDALGFELTSRALRDPALVSAITGVAGAEVDIAYLRGPGHSLELIEYTAPQERGRVTSRPCDTGFAHIAFNVDDVDGAVAGAAPHGFVPIGPPVAINAGPNKGRKVVYLRDGDGVTVEFIEAA
jgi:catechol 2,3-dioxygenase-like lactoylglutathione lyase family enzyme